MRRNTELDQDRVKPAKSCGRLLCGSKQQMIRIQKRSKVHYVTSNHFGNVQQDVPSLSLTVMADLHDAVYVLRT